MAKKQEKTLEQRLEEALVLYEKTPYKLPTNWCWTRLGTVCKLSSGEKSDKERLFYLDAKTLRTKNYERTKNNGVIVGEGQKVILVDGENSGEVFDVSKCGYMGSTFRILNINKALNEIYVQYFILSHQDELRNNKIGSAIPHLNKELFFNLLFPLAPLEEQRRIVKAIAKQFAKLDEARELIQRCLNSFALRKSTILYKAFTGKLTEKWRKDRNLSFDSWSNTTLSKVAKWGSGGTPSRKNNEYFMGDIPWIKTGELNNGYIYDSEEKITDEAIKHSSAKIFPCGTILIAMYGATIGQCAILGVSATTNQACACAIANENINNKFLFYFLISQKSKFISLGKGGAQPNISQKVIKELPILVPSIKAEQNEIVRILDSIFEKEDKSKELLDMLDKIDEMKKSILARAFRGELGTSNPADEPAIDLLKRILENQENVIDENKNNKKKTNKIPFGYRLNRRQLNICELLIQNDGLSIDALAQMVGKDVRFLFDDLKELIDKRMIKLVEDRYEINANNEFKNQ